MAITQAKLTARTLALGSRDLRRELRELQDTYLFAAPANSRSTKPRLDIICEQLATVQGKLVAIAKLLQDIEQEETTTSTTA